MYEFACVRVCVDMCRILRIRPTRTLRESESGGGSDPQPRHRSRSTAEAALISGRNFGPIRITFFNTPEATKKIPAAINNGGNDPPMTRKFR